MKNIDIHLGIWMFLVAFFCIVAGAEVTRIGPMDFSFGRLNVLVPPKTLESPGTTVSQSALIQSEDGKLVFQNSHYTLKLKTKPSLQIKSIYNKYTKTECLTAESRLLFVWIDEKRLEAKDLNVADIDIEECGEIKTAKIKVSCPSQEVTGDLTISIDGSPEIRFDFSFVNTAKTNRKFRTLFPYIENLQIGEKAEDNYYFFPFKGGFNSNKAYDLASAYGAHPGSFQLMCLYNPILGGGIYTRIDDNTGRPKTFLIQKKDKDGEEEIATSRKFSGFLPELKFDEREGVYPKSKGTLIGCYSYMYEVDSGAKVNLPTSILAVHDGDFTYALKIYKKWIHTWWKHIDTPQWFKDCYYYPVAHDILGNVGWEKGFAKDNKIELSQIARPYEHILELAYWMDRPKDDHLGDKRDYSWYRNAAGDYNYEEEWGGLEGLREEIKKTEMIGPRILLYGATQFGAWKFSQVFQDHPDWAVMDKNGNVVHEYWWDLPTERRRTVDMCGEVEGWQDYCAETNHRIIKDTGASGVFLDVMNRIRFCYNPKHKHNEYPSIAAEKLLRKTIAAVRSANSEAVIQIEDMCSDYLMQWVDGCWMKTFYTGMPVPVYDTFDLYSVSFMRFCLPEVKWTDHGPMFANAGRRTFFNGMGYNISEVLNKNDCEEAKAVTEAQRINYLIATCQLMKQNSDAFSSLDCDFLMPTMNDKVYANYFSAKEKVLYTIYNKNDSTINEPIIKVEPGKGFHCVELLYDDEVSFDEQSGTVTMEIGSWEVVCLARLPKILQIERSGNVVDIKLSRSLAGPLLKVFVDYDDGRKEGENVRIHNDRARIDLNKYQGQRLIIKLFEGNYLIDEKIVKI